MPHSTSAVALSDIRELLERALVSPKGIRVSYETNGKAVNERNRCNTFRKAARELNAKAYGGDPDQAVSKYDTLVLTIPKAGQPGDNVLTIAKRVDPKVEEIE